LLKMPSKKNRRNKKKVKPVASSTNKPETSPFSNQEDAHQNTPNDRVVPNGHPVSKDHHECTDGHNHGGHSHQHSNNANFNQNGQQQNHQHPAYDSTGNTTTYTSQQTVTSTQSITTSQTVTSSQYYTPGGGSGGGNHDHDATGTAATYTDSNTAVYYHDISGRQKELLDRTALAAAKGIEKVQPCPIQHSNLNGGFDSSQNNVSGSNTATRATSPEASSETSISDEKNVPLPQQNLNYHIPTQMLDAEGNPIASGLNPVSACEYSNSDRTLTPGGDCEQTPQQVENMHEKKQKIIEEYNQKVNLLNYKKVILLDKYEQKLDILINKKRELLTKLVYLNKEREARENVNHVLYAAANGLLANYELADYAALDREQRTKIINEVQSLDQIHQSAQAKDWIRVRVSNMNEQERISLQKLNNKLKRISPNEFALSIKPLKKQACIEDDGIDCKPENDCSKLPGENDAECEPEVDCQPEEPETKSENECKTEASETDCKTESAEIIESTTQEVDLVDEAITNATVEEMVEVATTEAVTTELENSKSD